MYRRLAVALIFVLGFLLTVSSARFIEVSQVVVVTIDDDAFRNDIEDPELTLENENLCTLCEQFASQAVDYFSENKTQAQIIGALHQACSQLHSLEQQCLLLVDYYTPLFFLEIDQISPDKFCKKVNLCEGRKSIPQLRSDQTCALCQQTLVEILLKLKNPDAQLEIVEALLKACSKSENFAQQCKKLVFEYAPVILVNAEKFLETTDVCSYIHACKASELPYMKVRDSQPALYQF